MQEVVIMSNACDTCGYRSSDIKAGGGVSDKGSIITLDVSEQDDLRRDVIKAESASISIPEADLEVTTGQDEPALCASSRLTCMHDILAATNDFSMLLCMPEGKDAPCCFTLNGTKIQGTNNSDMLSSTIIFARAAPQAPQARMYDALLCTGSNMVVVVQAAWVASLQLLKAC